MGKVKEKILRKFKLFTLDEVKSSEEKLVRTWEHQLHEIKKAYEELQKMKNEEVKRLQDRIEELDFQNQAYINELTIKSSQIKDLKEAMSKMYTLEQLKPQKAKKQTMKVKSSSVRSKIAKNTVKELEEISDE